MLQSVIKQALTRTYMMTYCQISNTRRAKSQKLNVSRLVLQLFLPNPSKPGVKSRIEI